MRKLSLILAFATSLFTNAQIDKMEGSWVSENSSYVMTVLTSDSIPVKIFNTSFLKNRVIEEDIISYDEKTITTTLYNKENDYRVSIKYILKDPNTMLCYYTGDLNELVTVKKLSHFYME